MRRRLEGGEISAAVVVAVTMTLLFAGAVVFGFWAFAGKQDYKNNVNQKIDAAVEVAKKQTETAKDNEFAEASKKPVKTFVGSATYGSITLDYPRSYSAYVISRDTDSAPIDGYFQPNIVPYSQDTSVAFALRVKVVSDSYATVLKNFDPTIKTGKTKVAPFRAAKVPQALGSRIDGALGQSKQGTMIVLPLRDKTIEIWTESADAANDFSTYVIPSISFVP